MKNQIAVIGGGPGVNMSLAIAIVQAMEHGPALIDVPQFCNEAEETLIGFVNEIRIQSDGWAHLAPIGDFPNTAIVQTPGGALKSFRAMQRLDKESISELANSFKQSKLKKYLTGVPIYDGHPDMPGMGERYPDKTPKGIISDIQVRDDGLWALPIFTNEGSELVESKKRTSFSARWTAKDGGKMADGTPILRPNVLLSAGLTNKPNLPVNHLSNAEWQDINTEAINMKKSILEFLARMGVQLANDATEEQIGVGLKKVEDDAKTKTTLANEKETAVSELTNEKAAHKTTATTLETRTNELSTVRAELANERTGRIEAILDLAIKDGRITGAQREEWKGKLTANLANEAEAIKKLTPTLKTVPLTGGAGDRKAELANMANAQEKILGLVEAEMANSKCDYDTAFARVQKANAAMFQTMQQPEIKTRA